MPSLPINGSISVSSPVLFIAGSSAAMVPEKSSAASSLREIGSDSPGRAESSGTRPELVSALLCLSVFVQYLSFPSIKVIS